MRLLILGCSSCVPDAGGDTSSLLVNGRHLMDTGWRPVERMRRAGVDPLDAASVIISHFHQDHYLALPQVLFYIGLQGKGRVEPLRLVGPAEHLERVVRAAEEFLQLERFPELRVSLRLEGLAPGDGLDLGDVRLETCAARHVSGHNRPEPALSYKVTDAATGACFVYSGDTHDPAALAEFARGAALLIHDAAHPAVEQVAETARAADVGELMLTHLNEGRRREAAERIQRIFPRVTLAEAGRVIEI